MIWILVPIVWGLGAAIAVALPSLVGRLIRRMNEKQMLVIGANGVGKSTLIKFLGGDTSPGETTDRLEKYESFVVRSGELKLYIKKGFDVPGSDEAYLSWKNAVLSADCVVYLINVFDIYFEDSQSYKTRIDVHAERLSRWSDDDKAKKPQKLVVVGTHCDKIPENQRSQIASTCLNEFKMALGKHAERAEIVFGSLRDAAEARKLMYKLVRCILDRN